MPAIGELQLLIDHHGGGPVGLETLAAALGDDPVTLETVVEPFLSAGLLMRTSRPHGHGCGPKPPGGGGMNRFLVLLMSSSAGAAGSGA